jgi:hypothetical protein
LIPQPWSLPACPHISTGSSFSAFINTISFFGTGYVIKNALKSNYTWKSRAHRLNRLFSTVQYFDFTIERFRTIWPEYFLWDGVRIVHPVVFGLFSASLSTLAYRGTPAPKNSLPISFLSLSGCTASLSHSTFDFPFKYCPRCGPWV